MSDKPSTENDTDMATWSTDRLAQWVERLTVIAEDHLKIARELQQAQREVERLRNEARLLASRNRHLMQRYKELIAAQKYDEEDWQELLDERQNACIALCDCDNQAHGYHWESHRDDCRYRAVMTGSVALKLVTDVGKP